MTARESEHRWRCRWSVLRRRVTITMRRSQMSTMSWRIQLQWTTSSQTRRKSLFRRRHQAAKSTATRVAQTVPNRPAIWRVILVTFFFRENFKKRPPPTQSQDSPSAWFRTISSRIITHREITFLPGGAGCRRNICPSSIDTNDWCKNLSGSTATSFACRKSARNTFLALSSRLWRSKSYLSIFVFLI